MSDFTKSVSVFLLCVLFITGLSNAQGFNSIFSNNGTEVIAVGKNGNVFRSIDGGLNWGSYPLGILDLNSVYGVGNNIWIVGNNGAFYSSSNNGIAWSNQTLNAQHLKCVFFIDAITGWIAGANGTILKSTNGGVNWTAQNSTLSTDINSIKFISANNGTACGNSGKVIYTTNGGTAWNTYVTPVTGNLLSIDQTGVKIIATGADGFIIKYNGTSWSTIDYKIDTKSSVYSVKMLDTNIFYTCGGGGFINKSTDAGLTFNYQQNPMMANLVNIFFYNAQTGWAVSSLNNAIIRTTDGGITWSLPANTAIAYNWVLKQASTGNIGNGFCLHPKNKDGIFIMMGNNLYRSLNRGETWTIISTITLGGSAHSFYVNAIDTNLMLAAKGSTSGRIIRSTNYGQTWTDILGPINLTSYGMPLEVDQNNPNICYLGPDNSVLKKSTDFGETWTNIGTTVFRSPCDFVVLYGNPNTLYCGDGTTGSGSGEFLKSTNGGVNWTSIHTVSGSEIPMIAISAQNPNLAFHTTWSSGGIWKTTDQWLNFTQPATTSNCWAIDIAKDDPTAMAYGTYATTVYVSTNTGTNFISTSVGSVPEAGMLFYDKGNLFAQHGGGVYKLNITYSVITSNNIAGLQLPKEFSLKQNYPNPFNPKTTINYQLAKSNYVKLIIYNVLGREIAVLVDKKQNAGNYEVEWNASSYASGIYFYSLFSDDVKIDTKKMIIIK
ncbi:MAG: T9SS C-terminal target domain-containing protein [Ignavibacteriae bacterium]|nr:MAG: T9SS C-terminal target domain-containing protein [Ignavibacteriota bacterium]